MRKNWGNKSQRHIMKREIWAPQHSPFCVHIAQCTSNTKFIAKNLLWENTACMTFILNGVQSTSECKNTSICIRNSNPTDDSWKGSLICLFITQQPFDFKRHNKNPTNKPKYSPPLLGIYLNQTCICKLSS